MKTQLPVDPRTMKHGETSESFMSVLSGERLHISKYDDLYYGRSADTVIITAPMTLDGAVAYVAAHTIGPQRFIQVAMSVRELRLLLLCAFSESSPDLGAHDLLRAELGSIHSKELVSLIERLSMLTVVANVFRQIMEEDRLKDENNQRDVSN